MAAAGFEYAADVQNILRGAGERGGDEVKSALSAEKNVRSVFFADIGHRKRNAGHINALAVGNSSAVDHLAGDFWPGDAEHPQFDQAVVNQDGVAIRNVPRQVLIRNRNMRLIAGNLLRSQRKVLAGFQHNTFVFKGSQTNFGTLGVQNGRDRKPELTAQPHDRFKLLPVRGVVGVRKVESRGVHSVEHHLLQYLFVIGGRAKSTDNFCFSHEESSFLLQTGFS